MPEEDSGVEAVTVTMGEHSNGFTGTGLYFTAEANDLPHNDWSVEYYPDNAGVI
jgi:hypothetical protein